MAGLSAVVVSHESGQCLLACLGAAKAWANQLIVIDNASHDRSVDLAGSFEGVTVVANNENQGFAGAVNQGMRLSSEPVVLVLNPDTVVEAGISQLSEAALGSGYGAAAGLLRNSDGSPQAGFSVRRFPTPASLVFEVIGLNRIWPSNPVNRRWRCRDLDLSQAQDIEQPAGAFLAIRREAWESIGGFDEHFHPLWFEDVDFCKRMAEAAWRIRFVPVAKARHLGAHSVRQMPWSKREVQWYVSLLRYAAKHFESFGRVAVASAVAIASVPRTILGILRQGTFEPVLVYGTVIASSLKCIAGIDVTASQRIKPFPSSGETNHGQS